ncbi:DUF4386 family protein [Corallococcus coralloides]|uniref:DUF4386 family protein n=1 Tax=Corallococcus coralloides TaxID=184914 RepID=UPI00030C4DD7|nr:DUF4386 family protein [Corallococcus coralloides]
MLFFSILREQTPSIAVAYVCTRVMEALTLIVGVVFLLCILQLRDSAQGRAGSVAFCLSLYRSRLLPSSRGFRTVTPSVAA